MHLHNIKLLSTSSIYVQVTATPQPIILQTKLSGWKPSFIQYFKPGKKYLGGDFFYSEPRSFTIRIIPEDELQKIRTDDDYITVGLLDTLLTFLVTSAHIFIKKQNIVCNLLIHPSIRIADHTKFAEKVGELLNQLLVSKDEDSLKHHLKDKWLDLQTTKPDIVYFEKAYEYVVSSLENQSINILTLNSNSKYDDKYDKGINIIIGGNSLGRGVTFAGLQTIYYCRSSRTPQADTFWQHCRMFGYDRDPGLMRIFIPSFLLKLFTDLNNAHRALVNQIITVGIDNISLVYPVGIKPTRTNVVEKDSLSLIIGGVSYFPNYPKNLSYQKIDSILSDYDSSSSIGINSLEMIHLLRLIVSDDEQDWNSLDFINCIESLKESSGIVSGKLIVRRGRRLSKGTGTMLSETDRKLVSSLKNELVLVLYRITGELELGWSGEPLWIPNIKLPEGMVYYKSFG